MERVADYIIRKVYEAGADDVFFIAGRGILYLTDALAKNKKLSPIATYHEQGASYAAMAYAGAREGIAACLVSTGCAATNAVTACLCSYQDNLPVVFISGNNPLKENVRHTKAPIRTYGAQEADIISVVSSITKYAVMLEDASRVVCEVEKALYLAQNGRRGPVWIDVPLDVQNMRLDESEQQHYIPECSVKHDIDSSVKAVVEALNDAHRPTILVGGGARGAAKIIQELSIRCNIPCVSSPAGCDIYGAGNELSIGTVGSIGGSRAGNFAVQNSDYILSIGSKLCSQLTGVQKKFAREAKVIAVDVDENEHKKSGVVDEVVHCDSKVFLSKLLKCDLIRHADDWAKKCLHWKKIFGISKEAFVQDLIKYNQLDLYSLMDMLSPILPDDATVITDAGFEELIVPSAVRYQGGQRCLFPATQGAMGYAIPAIIGAHAAGRKHIVCIVGDGSIMMNMQELQIIASMKIPAKIFVINNNMYAVIRKRQRDLFRNRTIGNDPSDGLVKPDFCKMAAYFGISYRLIKDRADFLNYLSAVSFDESFDEIEMNEIVSTPEQKYLHESYALNENRKVVHRPIEDMAPFLSRALIKEEMIVPMMEE